MEQTEFKFRKNLLGEAFELFDSGFEFELRFFDDRINDVALMPCRHFSPEKFPYSNEMLLAGCTRFDGSAAGRQFIEHGDVQVSVQSERERTRNGSGSENENVRGMAVRSGFVHELFSLQDAEAMLFVDGDESEAREGDVIFDQGVGADYKLRFAVRDALERCRFFDVFHSADE